MKVVRQARLELSGGSTPDQLRPSPEPPLPADCTPHPPTRRLRFCWPIRFVPCEGRPMEAPSTFVKAFPRHLLRDQRVSRKKGIT